MKHDKKHKKKSSKKSKKSDKKEKKHKHKDKKKRDKKLEKILKITKEISTNKSAIENSHVNDDYCGPPIGLYYELFMCVTWYFNIVAL